MVLLWLYLFFLPAVLLSFCTKTDCRQIHYGDTIIRIKHLQTQKYMTVATSYNWPAAHLGYSNRFHFMLYENDVGIRIKTLNTVYPGYEYAYSSATGWVYFDWDRDKYVGYYRYYYNAKQYWSISKAEPIYDGDIVTFRNVYYDDSGLCNSDGWLYCWRGREDQWVLEVVD